MHQRTCDCEVLREVVLPVYTYHRLSLHAIIRVRFQRHIDIGTCIDDTLIQDGHLASRVIDRIVGTLGEHHTTSRNDHRTRRHIISTQRNHVCTTALILSHQYVFIFLCCQFSHGLGRVVELMEHVNLCLLLCHATTDQLFFQVVAKGFCRRQEYTTIAHGIALYVIEIAIGVGFVVIVETVATQHLKQSATLYPLIWDISEIHTCGIALEFDVESELGALYSGSQEIHVLHHQLPVTLRRIVRGILQRPYKKGFRGLCEVGSKLAHLIADATSSKLVCHGQHLIGLQTRFQRDITQSRIHRIF